MIALTFSTVWATFLINLIFGISTTLLYWKLERRGDGQPALQHAR